MKKILVITSLILLTITSCVKDDIYLPVGASVPETLKIVEVQGLKLESTIVSEEVKMNVKLPVAGTYRIKIKDITRTLISQEKITGEFGNNLLKVYVSSLPNDGYTIELTTDDNKIIGSSTFVVQH